MCPEGACKETWLEYWKAGKAAESKGSCPTTPRPRTVSSVPDRLNMRQWRSLSWTGRGPRFSNLMQYLHCRKKYYYLFAEARHNFNYYPINIRCLCNATAHIKRNHSDPHSLGRFLVNIRQFQPWVVFPLPRYQRLLSTKRRVFWQIFDIKFNKSVQFIWLYLCLALKQEICQRVHVELGVASSFHSQYREECLHGPHSQGQG